MSKSSSQKNNPAEKTKPKSSFKRFDIKAMVALQLVAAIVLLIIINYFSSRYAQRIDLTQHSDFTLSELSTKYLSSDAFSKRKDPVKIIVAFRKSSPHYARISALIENYESRANGKIEVEYVDPIRDAERARQVADYYEIHFSEDLIIVDADQASTDTATASENESATYRRVVTLDDLVVKKTDRNNQLKVIGYQDEDAITAALIGAIEGKPRKIYFLSDKSNLEEAGDDAPWISFRRLLLSQNILLEPLKISEIESLESLPDDLSGMALIAPKYDLDERELDILKTYWQMPSSALYIVLDPSSRPARLRAFLRDHGITQRPDRILTVKNKRVRTDVRAAFTLKADANEGLGGSSTTFEGSTGSLDIREGSEELLNRKIYTISLIETAPDYWGETRYTEENPIFNKEEDEAGPLYLAAAVIKGNESSATDPTKGKNVTSRMIVINNSSFLHPDRLREEQTDFVRNSINWLIGRSELAGVGPRGIRLYKLNLIGTQVSFINKLNLFFIPGFLLLIALFVWNTRRA